MNEKVPFNIPQSVFNSIRIMIRDFCGIYYGDNSLDLFSVRLKSRMNQLGLQDVEEYFRVLQSKPTRDEELSELVEILANQETESNRT